MKRAPEDPPARAPARVVVERRRDGVQIARSPEPLQPCPRHLGERLEHWARVAPERPFLAERDAAGGWRALSYAQALAGARRIGQSLLDRGLTPERPIALLSPNGIDMALVLLGAMRVGVPAAPISVSYAALSRDYGQLRAIFQLIEPPLCFASAFAGLEPALRAVLPETTELVTSGALDPGLKHTPLDALLGTDPGEAERRAAAALGPDSVAKILFTSGSTGEPKGVINTQRMLCTNQQSWAQVFPFLCEEPPVLVDWLPWNHTFGGNKCFGNALWHGGTLYIDHGRPAPELLETTLANLREISPTLYYNVPRGFDALLPALEEDAALRARFFARLRVLCFAGAALPRPTWERLERLAVQERGERIPLASGWGATETGPGVTALHFDSDRPASIGLPQPGVELKLIPNGTQLELRVRGPGVTPGYWRRDDLTREAFDAEGFYRMGDAGRWTDPERPERGLEFDGRIAEDFKLLSGTWVHVGSLRLALIRECTPLVQDAVITGLNRDEVGALLFPNVAECRQRCPDLDAGTPLERVLADTRIREPLSGALDRLAAGGGGPSRRLARALLLCEPPSLDAGEITDKQYVNQRAVLQRRSGEVERLYREPRDPAVIAPARPGP